MDSYDIEREQSEWEAELLGASASQAQRTLTHSIENPVITTGQEENLIALDPAEILTREPRQPNTLRVAERIKALGESPLPVAKVDEPNETFTGKNPSRWSHGELRTVEHSRYQFRSPDRDELHNWFSDPKNGVGILFKAGSNLFALDLDAKKFASTEACDQWFLEWLTRYPQLRGAWIERTQSGGYRLIARLAKPKCWTNFTDRPGSDHLGEVLGEGRFAIVAPTTGVSGNRYRCLQFPDELPVIESLEAVGLHPYRKQKPWQYKYTCIKEWLLDPQRGVDLEKLLTKDYQDILTGKVAESEDEKDKKKKKKETDRSGELVKLYRELAGWANWLADKEVPIMADPWELTEKAGEALGIEEEDRIVRIIDSIPDPEKCSPAIQDEKRRMLYLRDHARRAYLRFIKEIDVPDDEPVEEFIQEAFVTLFLKETWIYCRDFFKWTGDHYALDPIADVSRRVAEFCNGYEALKGDEIGYPYANPGSAKNVIEWAKKRLGVDPNRINPSGGINCTNGVIELHWSSTGGPTETLEPHDPARHLYTYEPQVRYDPCADPTDYNELMECLEEPKRVVLMRVLAASLDLNQVRKHKGRMVRSLLLYGKGNNGKDALREVHTLILGGVGVTSCTLSDHQAYDQGRKFPLSALAHSRVNWPSENKSLMAIDKIECIKQIITGDPISIEFKGVDAYTVKPACIEIFNTNEEPNIHAGSEAIQSRFAVIAFNRTFSDNPKEGQLKADPRFKNDPEWVKEKVAPAFLNALLQSLKDLMREGIDYSCCQEAMDSARRNSQHLCEFAEDVGLHKSEGSVLPNKVLYELLITWYYDQGVLDIEGGRFTDNTRLSDPYVRSARNLPERMEKVFSWLKTEKIRSGKVYLRADIDPKAWTPDFLKSLEKLNGVGVSGDTYRFLVEKLPQLEDPDHPANRPTAA